MIDAMKSLRQKKFLSPTRIRAIEVERSSCIAPCGVKKRQQKCSSSECVSLEEIERDYGFLGVVPEDIQSIPLVGTESSRQGLTYHTADRGDIKNKRGKDCDDVRKDWLSSIA